MTAMNYVRYLAGGDVVAAHARCVWVLQARWPGGLKPPLPLLACICVGLKPPSPLRAMKGHFRANSNLQRCWRFQRGAQRGVQRWRRLQHLRFQPWCAKKLALHPQFPLWHAKKFSQQAQYGRKMLYLGVLGELFRGGAAERGVLGEFFRGSTAGELLKALTVSVRMRVVSPCGRLSSAGEKVFQVMNFDR